MKSLACWLLVLFITTRAAKVTPPEVEFAGREIEPPTENQVKSNVEFLVTNRSEIWRISRDGKKHRYDTNATAIGDVDYHLGKNLLFWIDAGRREIHAQSLNANETILHSTFRQRKNWEPVSLAVDFIGDKVYVADVLGAKIDAFELFGQYQTVVVATILVRPVDVKLDPLEGLMFVLDGNRIFRMNMDGNEPTVIAKGDIRAVHGLSVDPVVKRIHWVNHKFSAVMSLKYTGLNETSLKVGDSPQTQWTKFVTFNGSTFWASEFVDYNSDCCPESPGDRRKTIYESNPVPAIRVLHPELQSPVANPCGTDNDGCQQMCILSAQNDDGLSHGCACSAGWRLEENDHRCTFVNNFLIYSQPGSLKSYLLDYCPKTTCVPYLPISQDKATFADFDYHDGRLYYIVKNPLRYDTIYRTRLGRSASEIFLSGKEENYQSVSIDWITSNLYFTDSSGGTIKVVNTKNKTRRAVVLRNLEHPTDIVVHPSAGYVFFLQSNASSRLAVLSRANVDGSDLRTFDNVSLRGRCGFALDFETDRIYWFEYGKSYIQHSDLDVEDVRRLKTVYTKRIFALAVDGRWIYVSTTESEVVWRIDKNTKVTKAVFTGVQGGISKLKIFSNTPRDILQDHPCVVGNGGCSDLCFGIPPRRANWIWTTICANADVKPPAINCSSSPRPESARPVGT